MRLASRGSWLTIGADTIIGISIIVVVKIVSVVVMVIVVAFIHLTLHRTMLYYIIACRISY